MPDREEPASRRGGSASPAGCQARTLQAQEARAQAGLAEPMGSRRQEGRRVNWRGGTIATFARHHHSLPAAHLTMKPVGEKRLARLARFARLNSFSRAQTQSADALAIGPK